MKIFRVFYIILVFGVLCALAYKEYNFIEELRVIKSEKEISREEAEKRLDEMYKPRKADFYKEK